MRLRTARVAWLALLVGCSTLIVDPLEQMRAQNKEKLAKVVPGMTRMEVESVMGHERAGGGLPEVVFGRVQYLQATNPMREETVRGADGRDYLVLYYYTDVKQLDDKITDDELTPVVFRDGKVVGVGHQHLKR
ncbi:MAG TPA: DUF3192 domain-containing protein [Burkholderiales bacterium]